MSEGGRCLRSRLGHDPAATWHGVSLNEAANLIVRDADRATTKSKANVFHVACVKQPVNTGIGDLESRGDLFDGQQHGSTFAGR